MNVRCEWALRIAALVGWAFLVLGWYVVGQGSTSEGIWFKMRVLVFALVFALVIYLSKGEKK